MEDIKEITVNKPPPLLYHYTSQEGLIGIIETRSLRMTHIKFMNDASEYSYAMKLIGHEMQEIEKYIPEKVRQAIPADESVDRSHIEKWCDPLNFLIEDISGTPVYISSFSEMPDDISQWRGYCPKLGGFCIGFEGERLSDLAKIHDYLLTACIYEMSDQLCIIKKIMQNFVSETKNILDDKKSEDMAELARGMIKLMVHVSMNIWKIGPMIKDASFKNEKEWRIYSGMERKTRTKYRPGNSMLTPYIDFPLTNKTVEMPIREIIIGPTPHPELSEHSVKMLLYSNGIKCDVKQSRIPYRAW